MEVKISVEIVRITTESEHPITRVNYQVNNESDIVIWLVNDQWLVWLQENRQIVLAFARGKMQKGVHTFGYFPPTTLMIDPGQSLTQEIVLAWPLSLDRIWNERAIAAPTPGEYQVAVRVGYGLSPEPGVPVLGESVEDPIWRWQREVTSLPATMHIPFYSTANEISE